jgi:4'-phosphopantetheinyl transferase
MPLIYRKWEHHHTQIGVWQIEESAEWFRQQLTLANSEEDELATLNERKRLEWLAGRWLLHVLLGDTGRKISLKDEFGKPYISDSSLHISLSHSADKAAVIISPKSVGIDIQYFTEKIKRIERKFMREEESACLSANKETPHLHVFWGAKESLYKAYGKRELDFRKHLLITPFEYNPEKGVAQGLIQKNDFSESYTIYYTVLDNFSLSYCIAA